MNDPLRPSSSLDSTKRTPSLDDAKATTGAVQVVDNKEIERLRKVEKHSSVFTIVAAGAGLISDGIQNNLLTMTNVVFAQLYGKAYTSAYSTQVSNALTVGTILGQVSIGLVCDLYGRKAGILISTACIVAGIIIATAAHGAHGSFAGFIWCLTVGRGLTGIGVGGEYPSGSASAAEAANEKMQRHRGPMFIMVTNVVLSFGTIFACSLYLIVFAAAGGTDANYSTVWRTVFGISVIPPLIVLLFRLRMVNSKLYRDSAIQRGPPLLLTARFYWKSLVGTCGAWFLYDFVTFPNGVFSGTIIAQIVKAEGHEKVIKTAEYQLLLGSIALPGAILGAFLVNPLGRRNLMCLGFTGYLVIGLIVGCAYDKLLKVVPAFVILYGLMQSFGNLGPGSVLGLASAESYATAVRGTCYGFSAAIGKVGAVVGTQTFTPIRDNLGPRWTFIVAAVCGVVGVLVTFFFVRNDLNGDLADEDVKFAAFLKSRGWDGTMGVQGKEALIDREEVAGSSEGKAEE
ncbi:major facilitator superfamily domain-containing protein [Rhodotorula diobovata]|uniref:Major facilitator superfamily domain-containing protein n=1 Tax=Rhodotorula diobovata TaxID=5288 RepID=A0A5C5FQX3_9BASI|nr:major facilitator superfamily domain-containing protein [Rhodotorula diobovata]